MNQEESEKLVAKMFEQIAKTEEELSNGTYKRKCDCGTEFITEPHINKKGFKSDITYCPNCGTTLF